MWSMIFLGCEAHRGSAQAMKPTVRAVSKPNLALKFPPKSIPYSGGDFRLMVNWIEPQTSKRQVNKAGDRIRAGMHTDKDVRIVENWRASHAYVLNTFQANLRMVADLDAIEDGSCSNSKIC